MYFLYFYTKKNYKLSKVFFPIFYFYFMKKIKFSLFVIVSLIFVYCSQPKKKKILKKEITIKNDFESKIEIQGANNLYTFVKLTYEFEEQENKKDTIWNAAVNISSKKYKKSIFKVIKNKSQSFIISNLLNQLYKIPFEKSLSANFKYKNGKLEEVEPFEGNEIDTVLLKNYLTNIKKSELRKINLTSLQLYKKPLYEHKDERTKKAKLEFEKCLDSEITLKSTKEEIKLNHETFGKWLSLDDSMIVKVDLNAVQNYLQNVATKVETPLNEIIEKYSTTDTTSQNSEPTFERLKISSEIHEIAKLVTTGEKKVKDLVFTTISIPQGIKAGLKDFVEVSIQHQKVWLFKGGSLLLESDVVTGNKSLGRSTPTGTYAIKTKATNVTLKGADYEAPVSYWMPFYKGYGLHDANWRRRFGSNIYLKNGSHGCVNMPPKHAPFIFANVKVGTPVIIRD